MSKEKKQYVFPDCNEEVNEWGEAVVESCYYCANICDRCDHGTCDNSC